MTNQSNGAFFVLMSKVLLLSVQLWRGNASARKFTYARTYVRTYVHERYSEVGLQYFTSLYENALSLKRAPHHTHAHTYLAIILACTIVRKGP